MRLVPAASSGRAIVAKKILTHRLLAEAHWQKTCIIIPKMMGLSPAPTASSMRDIEAKNIFTHRQSAEAQ